MIVIIRALDIDISADTGPLPYAVKKPDANILKPQSRSAIDRYLVPASAISNSSLPGRSNIITIYFPNTRQQTALTMLVTTMNTLEYFMNTFTLA